MKRSLYIILVASILSLLAAPITANAMDRLFSRNTAEWKITDASETADDLTITILGHIDPSKIDKTKTDKLYVLVNEYMGASFRRWPDVEPTYSFPKDGDVLDNFEARIKMPKSRIDQYSSVEFLYQPTNTTDNSLPIQICGSNATLATDFCALPESSDWSFSKIFSDWRVLSASETEDNIDVTIEGKINPDRLNSSNLNTVKTHVQISAGGQLEEKSTITSDYAIDGEKFTAHLVIPKSPLHVSHSSAIQFIKEAPMPDRSWPLLLCGSEAASPIAYCVWAGNTGPSGGDDGGGGGSQGGGGGGGSQGGGGITVDAGGGGDDLGDQEVVEDDQSPDRSRSASDLSWGSGEDSFFGLGCTLATNSMHAGIGELVLLGLLTISPVYLSRIRRKK